MAAKGTSPAARASRKGAEPSFEESVAELESIIERIEHGEIGLEESLRQFKRGDELVKRCRAILDRAEHEVAELSVAAIETMAAASARTDSGEAEPTDGGDDGEDDEESPFAARRGDGPDE